MPSSCLSDPTLSTICVLDFEHFNCHGKGCHCCCCTSGGRADTKNQQENQKVQSRRVRSAETHDAIRYSTAVHFPALGHSHQERDQTLFDSRRSTTPSLRALPWFDNRPTMSTGHAPKGSRAKLPLLQWYFQETNIQ